MHVSLAISRRGKECQLPKWVSLLLLNFLQKPLLLLACCLALPVDVMADSKFVGESAHTAAMQIFLFLEVGTVVTSFTKFFGSLSSNFSSRSSKASKSSRDSEGTTPGGRGVEGFNGVAMLCFCREGGGAGFEPYPSALGSRTDSMRMRTCSDYSERSEVVLYTRAQPRS